MGKTKITQTALKAVLKRELKLKEPVFHFEKHGAKISGSIVSDTFDTWDSARRQREIWDVLDQEYGPDAVGYVGVLFAYTTIEWNAALG